MDRSVYLSGKTSLSCQVSALAVEHATRRLREDWELIFATSLASSAIRKRGQIRILSFSSQMEAESYRINRDAETNSLEVESADELGCARAIHAISTRLLGTDPYDFWTDAHPKPRVRIQVDYDLESEAFATRFRGWFINDEDCLLGWDDSLEITPALWGRIFETILRAGYNMVVPGTAINPDAPQLDLAAEYGLWIAQHHAEPLGATVYGNAYPDEPMTYPECQTKLFRLYEKALACAKKRKTIWTLGLRGQGDKTFAHEDARYRSPDKLGALISDVIRQQKRLIETTFQAPQHFACYLYAESTDLYRDGHLELDPDIMLIWSDNGFGGMRRRKDLSERTAETEALPTPDEAAASSNGIYYHLSFYDVQVASKLTPWISPQVIAAELDAFKRRAPIDFALFNVSNIRPFLYQIELCQEWMLTKEPCANANERLRSSAETWWRRYYGKSNRRLADLQERYYAAHPAFGKFADNRIGEMVGHNLSRLLVESTLKNDTAPVALNFLETTFDTLPETLGHLNDRLSPHLDEWDAISEEAQAIERELSEPEAQFFRQDLKMHCLFKRSTFQSAALAFTACQSYLSGRYKAAFVEYHEALLHAREAHRILRAEDRGKWQNYHRGDWITNTRETLRVLTSAREMARIKGDPARSWDSWSCEVWIPQKMHLATKTARTFDSEELAHYFLNQKQCNNTPAHNYHASTLTAVC